ncbi:MAG: hypothetical protein KAI24_12710 [Planctomycetes bacterium]|nr:hypothetical protein [Planctomycetota bacterium]
MASRLTCSIRLLSLCTAAALLAPPAAAQGVKELRLKDGRVLVGKVQTSGDTYQIETHDGNVVVAQQDVAGLRDQRELQAALKDKAKKAGDSAFANLNLARIARDYGLETEMWRHLDEAIEKLPAGDPSRPTAVERQLRDFLAQLEPELLPRTLRQAPTAKRIQALLRMCHAGTKAGKLAAIEELMVREPNADQPLRQQARRNGSYRQRIAALAALQRRKIHGNDRFVMRTTVLDRNRKVRAAAVEIGKPTIGGDDIAYMASGLGHSNPKVRVRTAEAMGAYGHEAAVDLLVKAGPHAASGLRVANDTGASRGHIAFLRQQAYIRDFDVEVAQAAFIADPKVDVLQSGSVLDVTVAGVSEVRTIVKAYRGALKLLTSHDPGPDPRTWPEWREKLPAKPTPAATRDR